MDFLKILYILGCVFASIDFSSTRYPFPSDELTGANSNIDTPAKNCSLALMSDGKCDGFNNIKDCNYDGGDCCRFTCENNCQGKCLYACGSEGYDCLDDTGCSNCVHGTCKPMSKCFETEEEVLLGITNCLRNSTAHGNSSTADFYCGKDPYKSEIHSFDTFSFHFPGCGLNETACSVYQCCTDINENNVTNTTCDDLVRNATVYNPISKIVNYEIISCLDQFQQCFFNNSQKSKGECCQCEEGWVGKDCDIPTCFPPCENGLCVGKDLCNCSTGWEGQACEVALCSNCVNGDCIEPEVCDCYYGWNGTSCEEPYATPPCIHGYSTAPDTCACYTNYTGDRCEVPICSDCNHGWCISPGVCECYPPYYTKDVSVSWCTDLYCDEIYGRNCMNCTDNTCLRCKEGYFLDGSICRDCTSYDVNCVKCSTVCEACIWPYKPVEKTCTYTGSVEFSSKYFTVDKANGTANVYIHRIGPSIDEVSISYRLVPISGSFTGVADLAYIEGSLTFPVNSKTQVLPLTVYNSFFDKNTATLFYIILYNPISGILRYTNLTTITDFTWSDKGISIMTYTVLEIYDNSSQAISTSTQFSQSSPTTIKSTSAYSMTFTAYNSAGTKIDTALFIASVYRVTNLLSTKNCLFSTTNFFADSTLINNVIVKGSNLQYVYSFSNTRGMYLIKLSVALQGVYFKVYTNSYFSGNVVEEGVRRWAGVFNNFTMPKGNSSSTWDFVYFPETSLTGFFNLTCNSTDYTEIVINNAVVIQCYGSCSSGLYDFVFGSGYMINVKYKHYSIYPGFYLNVNDMISVHELYNVYALNSTGKSAQVYVVDADEC